MFDRRFDSVRRALPSLSKLGVSHVLVSPPQKSNPSRRWWGRYQPVDFRVIEGPLGSLRDLRLLIRAGQRRGIHVLVDAVLHHMTNHPHWVTMRGGLVVGSRLPAFTPEHFASPWGRMPVSGGMPLPALRHEHPHVRAELRRYLQNLYSLGIRGFRFDAAKHIPPDFFREQMAHLPPVLAFGEIVSTHASHIPGAYLESMKAYDFPLASSISEAFSWGGDLRSLVDPRSRDRALWGPQAVTFVNKHDLVRNRKAFGVFRVANPRDRELAHVYLLGRGEGTPCLYRPDLKSRVVKAAARLHTRALGHPVRWLGGGPSWLAFTRGGEHLVALNKGGSPIPLGPLAGHLSEGTYLDNFSQKRIPGSWLRQGGVAIPARGFLTLSRLS